IVDSDGRCGMALWGDDPTTDEIDGFCEGEKPEIRIHAGKDFTEEHLSDGSFPVWTADGFGVVNVSVGSIPVEFGLKSAYPNPFNSTIVISFAVNSSERTTLRVFDITGREVTSLFDAVATAGNHRLTWDGSSAPSGIYLLKLESGNEISTTKVVLMR
ncbi:T9SS type A sorting domain-containing protein, partial [bacterium]|nr:T9SS type A sorting domain-containing protein [bacterium]